jgi:hypothetical protein
VIPFVEQKVPLPEPFRPDPPLNPARMAAPAVAPPPARVDEEMVGRIKDAVQSRLARPVDAALLDSVVRRVLAAL